jgi:DNA polymerase I-like protein with 3'-5' exonuclease and polymerase domains
MTRDDFTVFDIETTGKTPWTAKLLRAGIGDTSHRMPAARREMRALLKRPGVIVEHTAFDARWALLDGATLGPKTDIHDMRQMAWLLDEEQHLKLSDLMMTYLGEGIVKPIVQRANEPVWSTDIWPLDGEDRKFLPLDEVPDDVMDRYNGDDLDEEARLYEYLRRELQRENLWELFLADEVPLARELVLMESRGLPFDEELNETLRSSVRAEADALEAMLQHHAGVPVNLASPPQVARLLFTPKGERVEVKAVLPMTARMRTVFADTPRKTKDDDEDPRALVLNRRRVRAGLPKNFEATRVGRDYVHGVWIGKGRGLRAAEHGFGSSVHWKSKDKEHAQPSTSSVSLVLSNPEDDFIADLVLWRELDKLEGSFLAKFPRFAHEGRLHGTFNRTGTVTGRFSSAEPNLQNIPAHGQYGNAVRSLFRGRLALGDYAQLEQRVAAHYSEDAVLLKAYREDVDLYGLAASILWGGDATKEHPKRGLMKTGLLSLQYGAGAGKLAQLIVIDGQSGITMKDSGTRQYGAAGGLVTKAMTEAAHELIDQLHTVFPDYFACLDSIIKQAIHDGHIITLGGRYRHLAFPADWARRRKRARQWYSEEEQKAGFMLERQAVSSKMSGSAADIVAGAMVVVGREMSDEVATLVQVHDEIVWERLAGWNRGSLARLRDHCENGFARDHSMELKVNLVFEAKVAKTWADKSGGATNIHSLFRERQQRDSKSEGLQSRKASGLGDAAARREVRLAKFREDAMTGKAFGNAGAGKANRRTR